MEKPPAKLLDRARYRIRLKGYSIRTEQSYVRWPGLINSSAVIHFVTASLPIYCRTDTTFAQFRS